jgi:hypothetical protein
MGSVFGGGGGGGGTAPDTTTQFIREAPGIEERKLELMDLARQTAQTPINIPDIQVQQLSPLEQAAITQAGVTGIGAPTLQSGIGAIQGAQTAAGQGATLANQYGAGAVQAAGLTPSSSQFQQFLNPNQQYVIDAINRQMQQQQNQIASQAIGSGAFGGGREGVQRAELGALGLEKVGLAQQQAYNQAMQAFQNQQQLAAQTGLQAGQLGISGGQLQAQTGLSAGSQLGQLGQVQQNMAGTDIQRQIAAGGLQRQIAQAQLDASRQTQLQRSAEPLQRLEFLSNIYAAGPKSTSGITAATTPQSSPLAQSLGAGLAAYNAYGLNQATSNSAGNTALSYAPKTFNKGGIVDLAKVKKFNKGAMVSTEDDESTKLLTDQETGSVPYLSPQMRSFMMLNPIASKLLQTRKMPGESGASSAARGIGEGLEKTQDAALSIAKYDAAVEAAKAKGKKTTGVATSILNGKQLGSILKQRDENGDIIPVGNDEDQFQVEIGPEGIKVGTKVYDSTQAVNELNKAYEKLDLRQIDSAVTQLENTLSSIVGNNPTTDLPGVGPLAGYAPDFMTSARGLNLRADLATASNILLRARSGAAVTDPEMRRFLEEMQGGKTAFNEGVLVRNISRLRQIIENDKQQLINQYSNTKGMDKFLRDNAITLRETPKNLENFVRQQTEDYKYTSGVQGRVPVNINGKDLYQIGDNYFTYDPKTSSYKWTNMKEFLKQKNKKGK